MISETMNNFRSEMNRMGSLGTPFLFIIDFDMSRPLIFPLDGLHSDILYSVPGRSNFTGPEDSAINISLDIEPVGYGSYLESFERVIGNIKHGNSYLVNLTFPTRISAHFSLEEIFHASRAKYRLLYRDRFVVFSPETFVKISENTISTFPMKGTIDASVPDAAEVILADRKEKAEHDTIVDLLRNDLSIVADNVEVKRYRYIDKIITRGNHLLQVSSEISGVVEPGWKGRVGDIIVSMLPAGSVSGAPKIETLRIIRESEIDSRGYYTGVFGIYDGKSLDSAVMIRFIEQNGSGYVYRSGGGITHLSDPEKEYAELISKIYVPVG